jgi:hypothetical protein
VPNASSISALCAFCSAVAGCVPSSYTPGALTDPPPGTDLAYANARRVSDCLDLAAWPIGPSEGGPSSPEVLFEIETGNRCDRSLDLDLARLHVTAVCGGRTVQLSPSDPPDPPSTRRIVPHGSSNTRVLYEAPRCPNGLNRVCLDVSTVTPTGRRQAPICFGGAASGA